MRPVAALPIVVTNSGGVHRGFSPGYLVSQESRCKCGFGARTAEISWLLRKCFTLTSQRRAVRMGSPTRLGWGTR
jgi:hypothetical protein